MIGRRIVDTTWERFGRLGKAWLLQSFSVRPPPTRGEYLAFAKKYRGEGDGTGSFLRETKEGFERDQEYALLWNGLCKVGESVQVVPVQSNVVALSRRWTGQVKDHSDLEVWITEERTLWGFGQRVRFACEVYSFGSISMGPHRSGTRVAHRRPFLHPFEPDDRLRRHGETLQVLDAVFSVQH